MQSVKDDLRATESDQTCFCLIKSKEIGKGKEKKKKLACLDFYDDNTVQSKCGKKKRIRLV
jgi:hypothetical protein